MPLLIFVQDTQTVRVGTRQPWSQASFLFAATLNSVEVIEIKEKSRKILSLAALDPLEYDPSRQP
jgi:hypothetical protein